MAAVDDGLPAGRADKFGGVTITASALRQWAQTIALREGHGRSNSADDVEKELCGRFPVALQKAVDGWRSLGVRGVWIMLPALDVDDVGFEEARDSNYGSSREAVAAMNSVSCADYNSHGAGLLDSAAAGRVTGSWVGSLLSSGFRFHHAEGRACVLVLWIPRDEIDMLPRFATHYVGVGGFVVWDRDDDEPSVSSDVQLGSGSQQADADRLTLSRSRVLAITEARGPFAGFWKIPGGRADPGEELFEACMREVLEETSVQCVPEALLAMRQATDGPFGMPDVYFVFRLRPVGVNRHWREKGVLPESELEPLSAATAQEEEIGELKWMPANEFFDLPHYQKGVFARINETMRMNLLGRYPGQSIEQVPLHWRAGQHCIYHGCHPDNLSEMPEGGRAIGGRLARKSSKM